MTLERLEEVQRRKGNSAEGGGGAGREEGGGDRERERKMREAAAGARGLRAATVKTPAVTPAEAESHWNALSAGQLGSTFEKVLRGCSG